MSQDSLSDPSKRPQIQDIYKIYQIYLLQQGTVHQFQSQGTAASGFQRPVSMTLSLFHFVFGTSMEKNNPFQSLETSTSFPWFGRIWHMVRGTFGSAHKPYVISQKPCDKPLWFFKNNLQTSNFKYATLWFYLPWFGRIWHMVRGTFGSARKPYVISHKPCDKPLWSCSITTSKQVTSNIPNCGFYLPWFGRIWHMIRGTFGSAHKPYVISHKPCDKPSWFFQEPYK